MDIENERSGFLSKLMKKVETFSKMLGQLPIQIYTRTDGHFSDRSMPPALEGLTEKPLPKQPTSRPFTETTTVSPDHKWFRKRFHGKPTYKPNYERTTTRPLSTGALDYEQNTIALYERSFRDRTTVRTRTKVEHPLIIHSGSSFGLEDCLWVALGGVGVLILMAIFMKLGRPISRVRRQLSNNRPAPDVITVTLNSDDRNLDMGSLLRLGDTAASTDPGLICDPPPPYIECVGSSSIVNKYDSEEPPPRYSASFESFKDAEPQVHIKRQKDDVQNDFIEDGVRVEFIAKTTNSNNTDDVASGKRRELVFDKGRIVKRLSLDLYSNTTES